MNAKHLPLSFQKSTNADDLTPNQTKIASSKPTDDAPLPTENNGNSHPAKLNQSHDPAHNLVNLHEKDTQDTHHAGGKSPEDQFTKENNGNSQSGKTFVEIATKSSNLQTREKTKTITFHILRDILESTSKNEINEETNKCEIINE